MSAAIAIKLRPVQPMKIERIPDRPIRIEQTVQGAPQVRLAGVTTLLVTGIGPEGPEGPPGPIIDPGDLTLYFENGLT